MITLSKRRLIKCCMRVIYEMAPNNNPRNIDNIREYIVDFCTNNITDYETKIEDNKLLKYIKDMLFSCVEFTQLNISQDKWDKGMRDPFCKENSGFSFTAIGHDKDGVPSKIIQSKDYFDFIDLDACVQNITYEIKLDEQNDKDCFLCKYAKEYRSMEPSDSETCKTCTLNPNYKFKREPHPMSLVPRNSPEYIKFMESLNKSNKDVR